MSFFTSRSGMEITGDPVNAFAPEFEIIPDGTMAIAEIKTINIVEKDNPKFGFQKFIEFTWKIIDGDYARREVTQKIKVFTGKPEQIDRALNMLKLLMNICNYRFSHDGEPTVHDFNGMIGKRLGIKIKEWSLPKEDGTGFMEGNFVSEVHAIQGFQSEVGVRKTRVETAFSRNAERNDQLENDIPF